MSTLGCVRNAGALFEELKRIVAALRRVRGRDADGSVAAAVIERVRTVG
jgi:hypothetical protein